jgi:hypothetical protein
MNKYIVPAAVIVIIVLAVITFPLFTAKKTPPVTPTPTPVLSERLESTDADSNSASTTYADGTYQEVGNYVSPGGPREINVTVTLEDDIITDAVFEGLATDPTSMRFQGEFGGGFKTMVVGRDIDDVHLTKVAGSSLTPIGFTDALEKVKQAAKS